MTMTSKNTDRNNVEEIVLRGITTITGRQDASLWTGTMTSLTRALNRVLSKHQRTLLPSNPAILRRVVNRVVNRIRNRGIGVRFGRATNHNRTRFVRFVR